MDVRLLEVADFCCEKDCSLGLADEGRYEGCILPILLFSAPVVDAMHSADAPIDATLTHSMVDIIIST